MIGITVICWVGQERRLHNMRTKWVVSNVEDYEAFAGLDLLVVQKRFKFYAPMNHLRLFSSRARAAEIGFLVDGYVMPRQSCFEQFAHLKNEALIFHLYSQFGLDFIRYLKGIFTLVILDGENFFIFNDRAGLKKFFYRVRGDKFIFSNALKYVTGNESAGIDREHGALFSLMEHFIDGMTLWQGIRYSTPAARVSFVDDPGVENYWRSEELIQQETQSYSFHEAAEILKGNVGQYLRYFEPANISLTLTGGNDSRMVLAALLANGYKAQAFTFGNPDSHDGVVARKVSSAAGIGYDNYFVSEPTSRWFDRMAEDIVGLGDSLVNIHRAHRLDAVRQEGGRSPRPDMLFTGFMGGDYIKGIVYNDYITAKLVRLWEFDGRGEDEIVTHLLRQRHFRVEKLDIDRILDILSRQNFFIENKRIIRQFHYVNSIIGALHDFQDITIFAEYIPYVVNIFMDIDFLEFLFQSKYSMMHKRNDSNQLRRLNQPALHCNVINILAPFLSQIEFSKHYSPKEFLGNRLLYVLKRVYRYYFYPKFPPSFPYGNWFHPYVRDRLEQLSPGVRDMVDWHGLMEEFKNGGHRPAEGYWHRFTNIINLDRIVSYFT